MAKTVTRWLLGGFQVLDLALGTRMGGVLFRMDHGVGFAIKKGREVGFCSYYEPIVRFVLLMFS